MRYYDGEYYHLYNRGAHKADVFFKTSHYKLLLRILRRYQERYHVSILAFCLLPNHYHFLIQQETDGDISNFIKSVFSSYTQRVNKQQGFSGTLFQGKAKAKHITSDEYIKHLARYIHLNPVEAKLVDKSENWPFSDYQRWIGDMSYSQRPLSERSIELRQTYFKDGNDYRNFVENYHDFSLIEDFICAMK